MRAKGGLLGAPAGRLAALPAQHSQRDLTAAAPLPRRGASGRAQAAARCRRRRPCCLQPVARAGLTLTNTVLLQSAGGTLPTVAAPRPAAPTPGAGTRGRFLALLPTGAGGAPCLGPCLAAAAPAVGGRRAQGPRRRPRREFETCVGRTADLIPAACPAPDKRDRPTGPAPAGARLRPPLALAAAAGKRRGCCEAAGRARRPPAWRHLSWMGLPAKLSLPATLCVGRPTIARAARWVHVPADVATSRALLAALGLRGQSGPRALALHAPLSIFRPTSG